MAEKIVHLIGQLRRGGAEKQLYHVVRALIERGWTQSVVSFERGGVWRDRLLALGVPVAEIPRHQIKPWRLWQLWRIVRAVRPRLLVSWSWHVAVYAHWLRGVGRPRHVVNVRSDFTVDTHSGGASRELPSSRAALEKADYVVANSAWGLEVLRRHGVRLRASTVIRNIVAGQGRASPGEPAGTPRMVAVGALKPLKAYDVLLEGLARLAAAGGKFEVSIAGTGPEGPRLVELAARLGLGDRVHFLGEVDDVPGLLAGAHLAVHPSRSEGLSNAILEAMAEGLPVVACAVGGTPEVIEDGTNGLLAPPGRPEALADAVGRLLRDPPLRARLGSAALASVQDTCGEKRIADQYEQVFRSLLSDRPCGGRRASGCRSAAPRGAT